VDLHTFRDLGAREGDGLVLALELVATTVVMAGLGWLLDGALGPRPVLTVVFGGFTLAYEVYKIVAGYNAELDSHIAAREPLRRGPRS
jgi:F0F1-type ATP synthase assembly protein I